MRIKNSFFRSCRCRCHHERGGCVMRPEQKTTQVSVSRISSFGIVTTQTPHVERANRDLELIKNIFPVYQAVPRTEVTGKIWSTVGRASSKSCDRIRNNLGRSFLRPQSWTRNHMSFVGNGFSDKPHHFVLPCSCCFHTHAHA